MSRTLVVYEEAVEEAEAQARFYTARAGEVVALRFVAEVEAIYVGLIEGRFVGVNHTRIRSRLAIKRVFLDSFPFAVAFYIEQDIVTVVALEALRRRPGYWRTSLRSR